MTPFQDVYDAFLASLTDDEWELWAMDEILHDFRMIMEGSIPFFKFPRVSLERNEDSFLNVVTNNEIQVIAAYMKCYWLSRTILTWENVKPMYQERDFSQANLIDKLNNLLKQQEKRAKELEATYYRSINYKPYDYTRLAGDNNG